jgi:hypothetical protein
MPKSRWLAHEFGPFLLMSREISLIVAFASFKDDPIRLIRDAITGFGDFGRINHGRRTIGGDRLILEKR